MAETPAVVGLSSAKRLTTRKRTQRGPAKREVAPGVLNPGQQTCPVDVFEGTLLAGAPEDIDIKVTKLEKEILLAQAQKKERALPSLVIDHISYSLFSHEELQQQAVYKVTKTDDSGLHTVDDPRGGVVDDDKVCRTCLQGNLECPGHYGIIELNEHIIHPMFHREVIDVLKSVCNSCGGLLMTRDDIESSVGNLSGSKRLRAIAEASKNQHCRRSQDNMAAGTTACIPNPFYKASKAKGVGKIFFSYDGKKDTADNVKTVAEIEAILTAISDEDAALMGFAGKSHPRRFITKSIPVIPICARAPVIQEGELLTDDITGIYKDIVKHNQALLKDEVKNDEKVHEEVVRAMTFAISHLIDNSDAHYKRGKKVFRDIKGRIQGKEAIIRNLIQGKRVNFSARTVLGPDPNLKFGEIGVPRVWAPYLTFPEIVSADNVTRLTQLYRAGRVTHITPAQGKLSGRRIRVTDDFKKKYPQPYFGDVVERWLQDGDFLAFNRQPTLHKQSIMGYKVRLRDTYTWGLHLSSTTPHNAD